MQATGLEQIARAFVVPSAVACHHHHHLDSQPLPPTGDPLKLHLELVDFDSVNTFLDFLGSFGGRLRELSLASVTLGGGDDGNGKGGIGGQCLPGLESVCLGYDGG